MHILISPNAFKNSLGAEEAANAIEEGLKQSRLKCTCEKFPVADGGDGTGSLLAKRLNASHFELNVHDPLGRIIKTGFGLLENGRTAVIEMADAAGLRLLKPQEYDPLRSSSYGVGELINAAVQQGAKKIILGVGGSATVDGGTGALGALGLRILNLRGQPAGTLPADSQSWGQLDLSFLRTFKENIKVVILCDVNNPLLGPHGAAAVFGPQKGADPTMVMELENSLTRLCEMIQDATGTNISALPRGGAAGGIAASFHALLGAELVKGIEYYLDLTDFNASLVRAQWVITGEGRIDSQTLEGKAPFGVALRAVKNSIPVLALAGEISHPDDIQLKKYFTQMIPVNKEGESLLDSLAHTADHLRSAAREWGNRMAIN